MDSWENCSLEDFIINSFQRVKIGDDYIDWSRILSDVPWLQDSICRIKFFLVYISDLLDVLKSCIKLSGWYQTLWVSSNIEIDTLESDLQSITNWYDDIK